MQKFFSVHIFFLISVFFLGCVSTQMPQEKNPVYTMQTDMFPQGINRSEYYQQMAVAYSLDGDVEKAVENFRLSILHNPNNITARLELADEYSNAKKQHLALLELEAAFKIDSQNAETLKKLGDLYMSAKLYSKAREIYEKMLYVKGKYEEASWALFYIYKIEKKYKNSLQALAKLVVTDKNNYKIAFEKSLIYKLMKNEDEYAKNIEKAYQLNPRDRKIIIEYAQYSFERKNFNEATEALRKYSNTNEFDFEVSHYLSYSAVQSGHYELAIREYNKQRPLAYDPYMVDLKKAHVYHLMGDLKTSEKLYLSVLDYDLNYEARFYLAQIYISQGKEKDAAFILAKIPSSSDYYPEARVRLALYEKYHDKSDESVNTVRMALFERPDSLLLYQTYADFLIESKRYVETVALLEKGILMFPKDEDLRLKMAFLHYRLNNHKAFKKQIFAALKINPESANAYSMLAELWYLKNKDPQEVIYFVKRAAALKSKNKNIKPLLAWALMQQNQTTEAVAIFEQYFEENPNESFFARSLSQVYRRGDIKQKSKDLADLATELEKNDSLRSRFIFKDETQKVQAEVYKEEPTRLPASLENN